MRTGITDIEQAVESLMEHVYVDGQLQMPAYPVCWLVAVSMREPSTVRITPR